MWGLSSDSVSKELSGPGEALFTSLNLSWLKCKIKRLDEVTSKGSPVGSTSDGLLVDLGLSEVHSDHQQAMETTLPSLYLRVW